MKKKVLALVVPLVLILTLIAAPALAAVVGTRISNSLEATTTAEWGTGAVSMTWSQNGMDFTADSINLSMVVGTPVTIWVKSVNSSDTDIPRVRFLAETDGDWYTIEDMGTVVTVPDVPDDWTGPITYDVDEGGYVFGPAGGFTMPAEYEATTELEVTAKVAGNRSVSIYAVQLPVLD